MVEQEALHERQWLSCVRVEKVVTHHSLFVRNLGLRLMTQSQSRRTGAFLVGIGERLVSDDLDQIAKGQINVVEVESPSGSEHLFYNRSSVLGPGDVRDLQPGGTTRALALGAIEVRIGHPGSANGVLRGGSIFKRRTGERFGREVGNQWTLPSSQRGGVGTENL